MSSLWFYRAWGLSFCGVGMLLEGVVVDLWARMVLFKPGSSMESPWLGGIVIVIRSWEEP